MKEIIIYRLEPYSTDLIDDAWEYLINEFPRLLEEENSRRILEGIIYRYSRQVKWRDLPRDFPSAKVLIDTFERWRDEGFLSILLSYYYLVYDLSLSFRRSMERHNILISDNIYDLKTKSTIESQYKLTYSRDLE